MTTTTDLTGGKSLLTSTTFWGCLIAFLPAIFDQVTQKNIEVVVDGINTVASVGLLGPHGLAIAASLGAVIGTIGRIKATKQITAILPTSK